MSEEKKKSLIDQLLANAENVIAAAKKPYIKKKIKRQFESAIDNLDEQIDDLNNEINILRGEMIEDPANAGNLIQSIGTKKLEISDAREMKAVLETEFKEMFD